MTYDEFLEMLEELELDLDSASEALDLDVSKIKAWEDEEEIPKSAEKWIKKEKVEFAELNNTNEDNNFDSEEEDGEVEEEIENEIPEDNININEEEDQEEV